MAKKKAALEELEEAMASLEEASASLPPPNLSLGSDLADIHISGTPGAAVSPGMILWSRASRPMRLSRTSGIISRQRRKQRASTSA